VKLYEIITEAWADKFDQTERAIRGKHMTMGEMCDYLEQEFPVVVLPETSYDVPPMASGSAALSHTPVSDTGQPLPPESSEGGRYLLSLLVGPGVDEDTPAEDVNGVFDRLRHELAHLRQSLTRPNNEWPEYIQPNFDSQFDIQSALYVLQNRERSQQVVDTAGRLVTVGATPSQFENAVDAVYNSLKNKPEGTTVAQLVDLIRPYLLQMIGISDSTAAETVVQERGWNSDVGGLESCIGQLAIVRSIATFVKPGKNPRTRDEYLWNIKHRLLGQYRQFIKSLHEQYRRVRGYRKSHEKEHVSAMDRTKQQRQRIRDLTDLLTLLHALQGHSE